MSNWWDEIEDRSLDAKKAEKLARALTNLPGDQEAKVKFLTEHMPLLEAAADTANLVGSKARSGAIVSYAFRLWRKHLAGGGLEKPPHEQPFDVEPEQPLSEEDRAKVREIHAEWRGKADKIGEWPR